MPSTFEQVVHEVFNKNVGFHLFFYFIENCKILKGAYRYRKIISKLTQLCSTVG